MDVTFDPAKDAANQTKHGISLTEAEGFEWDTAMVWPDTRRDYGEARMVALGYIGLRIMASRSRLTLPNPQKECEAVGRTFDTTRQVCLPRR